MSNYKLAVISDAHLSFRDLDRYINSRTARYLSERRVATTKDAKRVKETISYLRDNGIDILLLGDFLDPVSSEGIRKLEKFLETGKGNKNIEKAAKIYTSLLEELRKEDNNGYGKLYYIQGNHDDIEVLRKYEIPYLQEVFWNDFNFKHGDQYETLNTLLGFGRNGYMAKYLSNKDDKLYNVLAREGIRTFIAIPAFIYEKTFRSLTPVLEEIHLRRAKNGDYVLVVGHFHPSKLKHDHTYMVLPAEVEKKRIYIFEKYDIDKYKLYEIPANAKYLSGTKFHKYLNELEDYKGVKQIWDIQVKPKSRLNYVKPLKEASI